VEILFDSGVLLTGILVFLSRIGDVGIGTMRTISMVHGRAKMAFFLGFMEVSIWLIVITAVLHRISATPVLGLFYALGFSAGNVVGIMLEKRIALGQVVLRVISEYSGKEMAGKLREKGHAVTTFRGEGLSGPVTLLYVACQRKELKSILPVVKSIEEDAFYVVEHAGEVSRLYRPTMVIATGWRALLKRK